MGLKDFIKAKTMLFLIVLIILFVVFYSVSLYFGFGSYIQTIILLMSLVVNISYAYLLYNQIKETTLQAKLNLIPALIPDLAVSREGSITGTENSIIKIFFSLTNSGNSIAKDINIKCLFGKDEDFEETYNFDPISPDKYGHTDIFLKSKDIDEFFRGIEKACGGFPLYASYPSYPVCGSFYVFYKNIHDIQFYTKIDFSIVVVCNGSHKIKSTFTLGIVNPQIDQREP